ncbi:UNVERIFIED_CONTAM: hypothetical protein H355_006207 [Colinus virginianus]|nr:hypothetical protein H355_006207 [Colinus virginianus]
MEIKKGKSFWIFCIIWSFCKGKEPVQIATTTTTKAAHTRCIVNLDAINLSLVQVSTVGRSECTTWGNFHFHTFDHVKFTFPGTCTYVFASHCNDSYQDFNIQIRRSDKNSHLIYFTVTTDGVILEVKESGITVNGNQIPLPFSLKSILIEDTCAYFQVTSKLGLTLKWNWADTLLLDLEETYKEKICGLCGNYDGNKKNDLILDGYKMHPRQFGNFHKVEDPSEKCPDVRPDDHAGRHPTEDDSRCSKYIRNAQATWSIWNVETPVLTHALTQKGARYAKLRAQMVVFVLLVRQFASSSRSQMGKEGGHFLSNTDDTFVVIGEIIQCGTSKTMTCLKNVLVTLGKTTIKICSCGNIYMNNFIVKLPVSKDGITIFRPSTFFIKILSLTGVRIRVQMKPVMQLSITVDHSYQNRTSGLCGNFNNIQTDDFRTVTGAVEDSASAFGNSWKTRASCFDVEDSFEDPCSNSVDKEKFAQHWCALLSNTSSSFAACHSVVDPSVYIKRCMYDTCNAEKSEVALCSVLSTYSRDCAAAGITLKDWRQGICGMHPVIEGHTSISYFSSKDPSEECPETMVYNYSVQYCNQSCRSLDEPDPLCKVQIAPMEGCGCPSGTYLNDEEECVTPDDCPCYYKGKIVQPGNSFQEDKLLCKCIQGRLDCIGETVLVKDCPAPMYYFNCSSAGPGAIGSECQKSCKTQDMHCYVTECVSGCMCPDGLVLDGSGGCIPKDQCPCVHGGHFYKPGETIRVDCNTCTCNKRQWNCTDNPCKGTCTVYGNGHYMSFDGEKFDFLGDCDYILAQDFCPNNMDAGTFRIVIQNNACGKSLSICSLKITLIFESGEIRLLEGRIQEIATNPEAEKNYKVDLRGGYIVIETTQGMSFMWDQKTTVVVHVTPSFQGKVCGLCGDFDGRSRNDFTTRGQSVEMSIQEFGNSWKITSTCSNINVTDLCADQPFKSALGQKHCSIIKSSVFEACHSKVNPIPYYESCVSDFCGCDSVGDCECFCTSVAAYARSCSTAGVCINWRTPAICPMFCDYYNPPDKHEWFYKPCGAPCLKTCRNPQGKCGNILNSLEGCYPECSPDEPYFDEERRECVSLPDCTSCDSEEKLCTADSKGENVSLPMNISGHCAYSICNASCQIELIWAECKVIQTETLETCEPNSEACPPTAAPSATRLVPATTLAPVSDCLGLVPPRRFNESWNFGNCQIATCLGEENNIKLSSITCPPQQLKLCVNGFPFTKHHDETGCCEVFECQCICSGWGNEHYVTFDGTYYHFKENCTYVLVELIQPNSQKFWIHIDNYYCGATDGAVLFNDKKVIPDISKNGIRITSSGLYIIVEIPELEVYVSYSRLAFYIKLAFGKYYNNTMGLCGTCTNQKSDDAMKRNGEVIESFKEMALDWKVPVSTNRYCNPSVSEAAKIENYQHCEPSELCQIIWNLTGCHHVVPPQPYYEACVASRCSQQHASTECQSLQTYAALCGLHGVCVDWRGQASGQCGCTAQDGSVKQPREAWEHDCQYCTCDEETLNISCFPRPCAKSPPINCTKEGFVRKIKPRLDDPCCTETVCGTSMINVLSCHQLASLPKGVCVSEGVEFKPGAVVPKNSCEDCVCTDEQDAVTQTNRIQCVPVKCQTTCQQGFHHVEKEGQCCSQCEQVACVANFPFGSVTIEVGKSYKAPYDNCTQYTCSKSGGQFSLTSTVKVCLPFEESNCVPGTVDVTSDGCCKTCIDLPHKCKRNVKEQYIVHKHCKSAAPVPVPFCEGTCSTYSV